MSVKVLNEKLTKTQSNYTARYEAALIELSDEPDFIDVTLSFEGKGGSEVILVEDGEERKMSADNFRTLVKEMESQVKAKGAEAEKEAKKAEAERIKAEKEAEKAKAEAEAEEKRKALIAEARAELEQVIKDIASDLQSEDKGELDKNVARYLKGMHLDAAEEIGRALKEAKDDAFQGRGSTVLRFAKDEVRRAFSNLGGVVAIRLSGKADRALSNAEVSMTRKVYSVFMKHEGGMDSTFRVVDQRDPATGEELLGDDGNPLEMPVTHIALNKLYAVADFYNTDVRDKLLSFANRNSERAVRAAAKLMTPDTVGQVIDDLNQLTHQAEENAAQGEESLDPQDVILDHVAEAKGQRKPSTVKSIAVDAAWFGGDWYDIKRLGTEIAKEIDMMLDDHGQISNTALLERTLGAFFAPRVVGPDNLVNAFVSAGEMTEAQAKKLLKRLAKAAAAEEAGTGEGEDGGDNENAES